MKTKKQLSRRNGKKLKICFIPHSAPDYLGGVSLFFNNFINYMRSQKVDCEITWIYFGNKHRTYKKNGLACIEVPKSKLGVFTPFFEKLRFAKILRNNDYDVLTTGSGIWTTFYKKPKNQTLVHTFHGTVYTYYKNHLQKYNPFIRMFLYPYLILPYFGEFITKKADVIICVSEKVRRDVEALYGAQNDISVIRTGVDLKTFKPKNKNNARRKMGLEKNFLYGLYVGRGGYWTKGLDRVINLSKELYNKDKNYRLIVIGPEGNEVNEFLKEDFIISLKDVPREKMPDCYASSDMFFCLSRIEGGAPTLVVSEAMASGCLVVTSKSSEQEIINNKKNGLVIDEFGNRDAQTILDIFRNENMRKQIIKESLKEIRKLSLDSWGKKYMDAILPYGHNS